MGWTGLAFWRQAFLRLDGGGVVAASRKQFGKPRERYAEQRLTPIDVRFRLGRALPNRALSNNRGGSR